MHSHQHIRTSLYAAFLLAAFALSFTLLPSRAGAAFNATATNPAAPSALSGAAALEHLKQQGTYQALRAAVADTRANAAPDALIGQHVKLTANDGAADDVFGIAVAVSGNTAVIGAPGDDVAAQAQGSVYVFVRSGGGWAQQARLNALDGGAFDTFGSAVALHGDTVVIGAYGNNGSKGAVYVFTRTGVNWTQQAKLTASDGVALDAFGFTVALSGDTLVAGAHGDDASKGAAYVFTRNGAVWSQQAKLTASDGVAQELFATAVALSGDSLVAGSGRHDISGKVDQGAAYVFIRSGVTPNVTWSQQAKLTASDGAAGDFFGSSVALSGDTLVAGAARDDVFKGAAYVFVRSGAAWNQQAKLTAGDGAANEQFGNAVAISGVTVVVGAFEADSNGVLGLGAGYVFARNGAAWVQQAILSAADGTAQDHFGVAVAVAGDTVVVGAYEAEVGANLQQGAAYVFTVQGSLTQQQVITAADGGADEYFGTSVAVSGNTAVIAAPYDNIGANQSQGAVYVYVRNGGTWSLQQKLTAGDGAAQDGFGYAVALSGDTLVAGAFQDTIGTHSQQGSAYVFVRTGAVWSQLQKLTVQLGATGDHFGSAVAMSGDTMVIGTYKPNGGTPGAAYVYVRSGATWVAQAVLTAADVTGADDFGTAVAVSGNTALVGTRRDTIGLNAQQGSVYVFVRNGALWSQQAKLTAADGAPNDFFGDAVALDGNTAVIGAVNDTVGANVQQGSAYVFARNGAVWSQQQKLTSADGAAADIFGGAVAVNGEALVIGAYGGGNSDEGAAYLFVRNGAAWEQRQKLSALNGGGANDFFGFAVALSSDTVVIGAANSTVNGNLSQGRAYVFAGAACPALTINPASLANGTVGTSYNATITASGGLAPYDFTVSLGTLPPGLTLSATGLLSGTPVTAGTFSFTITATAATLCSGNRSYTVIVNSNCPAITVNPAVIPAGTFGQAYSQTLTASGGTPGYSFIINVGNLPNGMTLAANGGLSGTPTLAGVFNFTATATDANGCQGLRAYSVTINPSGAGTTDLQFYPLAHPVRLLDTRVGFTGCDTPNAKIAGGTSRHQTAAGRTCDGLTIPANAKALAGNITTVQSGGGYLTLYPSDAAQPLVANSNFAPNEILNNVFTVGLGADGAFNIFVTTDTNVVVDITGYYAPPSVDGLYFHPLPKPIRLLETRQGQPGCNATGVPIQGGFDQAQLATITCNNVTIPASAKAIVGNATSLNSGAGFLTLYPQGASRPLAASSNFTAGQIMNAPFTVALGAMGEFMIYSTTNTDLVVDVLGYYSDQLNDANGVGLLFNPLPAPVRLLDTRAGQPGCYTPGAPLAAGSIRNQQARGACGGQTIANNALAVVGNATVVTPTGGGYLTFWPNGASQPLVATTNFTSGQIFNRHFTVGLGATGIFNIFASAQTDLVIDVSGYFAP